MKKKKWIALILVLCLLIPSLAYATHYAYWGRRHAILWDVSKIRVVRDEDDDSSVILIYDYSVKNWPHDFRKHDYYLVSNLTGEPCIWDSNVISNNKKVPKRKAKTRQERTKENGTADEEAEMIKNFAESNNFNIAFNIVVLPVPGPPVIIHTLFSFI